jgi:AcrR family transcriptional regulator
MSVNSYTPYMPATTRTLADVKRQAVVEHVLTTARHLVIDNGLGVTMDQIAVRTGVSRRTLFRLFDNRDRLIVEAFKVAQDTFIDALPHYDGDIESWLRATCDVAHRMNSRAGPGYWELTSRSDLPPDLAELEQLRGRQHRHEMSQIAQVLWRAATGEPETPAQLVAAVSAHLSAYFTGAVMNDTGETWQTAADLAYDAILAALRQLKTNTTAAPDS